MSNSDYPNIEKLLKASDQILGLVFSVIKICIGVVLLMVALLVLISNIIGK